MFRPKLAREAATDGPRARESRPGEDAPPMLRVVALLCFVALIARMVATALPGSRSGIEVWIRRADALSGLSAQLAVLLGGSLLVLLVLSTFASRDLGAVYRILVVPAAASVLVLVMLASSTSLDPILSLALGASCLALSSAGASTALGAAPSRAAGLVISLLTLGAASRLGARLLALGAVLHGSSAGSPGAWLVTVSFVFDVLAVALAGTRLVSERRTRAPAALAVIVLLSGLVAWGARRGSLDHAALWQVIAAHALEELSPTTAVAASLTGHFAVDAAAVLLAGVIALWPSRLTSGTLAVALALLSRAGVDVPASALMLALGALVAALGSAPDVESFFPTERGAAAGLGGG